MCYKKSEEVRTFVLMERNMNYDAIRIHNKINKIRKSFVYVEICGVSGSSSETADVTR